MDSQVKSLQKALKMLARVYDLSPGSRHQKVIALYELASQVKEGSIVELGTYQGLGAITMSMAASVPVYTIDDYIEKRGWASEKYSAEDLNIFMENCAVLGHHPHLLIRDAVAVAEEWLWPVGMIFWDLGVASKECALASFIKWDRVLINGGLYAFHDTPDQKLGYGIVAREALKSGRYSVHEKQYPKCGVFVLRKTG